jgi:putative transposase
MPNYRRLFVPGGTYFFTVNLRDRKRAMLIDRIDILRRAWLEVTRAQPFETIAAVVLPDHLHFMWRLPDDDHDFPARIRLIKSGFTRRLPASLKTAGRKGERNVWQRRFWEHLIRNEEDFERHVNYIHFNPVKHGIVVEPDDWPHSTWARWKREFGRPINIPPEDWKPLHLGEA